MANIRDIKNRISSVQNIKKITETMEKIATAKSKKNTDRLMNSQEYYQSLIKMLSHIIPFIREEKDISHHPLIRAHKDIRNVVLFVISSNRGLCGGYNHNLLHLAHHFLNTLKEDHKNIQSYVVGKKGVNYYKFNKLSLEKSFIDIDDNVTYEGMSEIADGFCKLYTSYQVDEVYIVYTKFYSQAQQKPIIEKILPFEFEEEQEEEDFRSIYIFEPDGESVLDQLLPLAIRYKLFDTILETNLSEQIARKLAMKQATDSAGDMIRSLTLDYNRARQSKITKELIEIMGAAKALHS